MMSKTIKNNSNDIGTVVLEALIIWVTAYGISIVAGIVTNYINSTLRNRNFTLQEIQTSPTGFRFVFKRDEEPNDGILNDNLNKEALKVTKDALTKLVKEGKIESFNII